MATVRTAPLFTATANARRVTFHLVDASNDIFAQDLIVPVGQAGSTIETVAAAYQAATNLSLYAITDVLLRTGDRDPDNATAEYRATAESGINSLFKNNSTLDTFPFRLPGPIAAVMQGNQDIPLLSATEMTALIEAILAIKTGYAFQNAQYTGRRERKNNPRVG